MSTQHYRFVGRNGFKTRWREYKGIVPYPKRETRDRLGEGFSLEVRQRNDIPNAAPPHEIEERDYEPQMNPVDDAEFGMSP